jgi:hypothetical protein
VDVADNAGNVMATYSWSFLIEAGDPFASNPSPANNTYTNDATPLIEVDLDDLISGIDDSTIVLTVEGSIVSHSWDGTTVSYTPSTPFAHEQQIDVEVDVSDNAGNAMDTYEWRFFIDLVDPVAVNPNPADLSVITNNQPTIEANLSDALSGINNATVALRINGAPVIEQWNGSVVSYTPSSPLSDGLKNIRLTASDNAGNSILYLWSFTIDTNGPTASNEAPSNNSLTNDDTPTISVDLTDALSGVDVSSITFVVEGITVTDYTYSLGTISWTANVTYSDGQVINCSLDASDNAGNAMATYTWSFTIDTAAPTLTIEVDPSYSTNEPNTFDIVINLTSNENLTSVMLAITRPDSTVQNIPMNSINETYWQLIYEVSQNGTHAILATGYDIAGNSGTDTDSFDADFNDVSAPNYTALISDPMNLLYNLSSIPSDWSSYPESAGVNVNITIQFSESVIATAITEVTIIYKASTETNWTSVLMTDLGSQISGSDRVDSFSFLMPAYRNGTTVNFTILAKDAANNEFQLNASGSNWGYTVLGNWLENITIIKPVPEGILYGNSFSISANVSFGNENLTLRVHARIHDPSRANLEPTVNSNFTLWNNTMILQKAGDLFTWSYPYPENIFYGLEIYLSFQIYNNATNTTEQIGYAGGYYTLATPFVFMASIIDQDAPGILTPVLSTITPTESDNIDLTFDIEPQNASAAQIEMVRVYYRVGGGEYIELVPIFYDGEYSTVIPKQAASSVIEYYIVVKDEAGNTFTSQVYTITVQAPNYNAYILLAILIGLVITTIIIAILQNRSKVKKATGKERYKYIKKVGGK